MTEVVSSSSPSAVVKQATAGKAHVRWLKKQRHAAQKLRWTRTHRQHDRGGAQRSTKKTTSKW